MHLIEDEAVASSMNGYTELPWFNGQAVVIEDTVNGGHRAVEANSVVLRVVLERVRCRILLQVGHVLCKAEVIRVVFSCAEH